MERPIQIIYLLFIFILITGFLSAQERWSYSAEEMEKTIINGQEVRRLNENVRFVKTDKVILTDNASQYLKEDILHLNGNTMMINNLDTLTCDSMVYWSKLDSVYAKGNIRYVHGPKRGIFGDEMEIQYEDSLVEMIRVFKNAFAYNDLNIRINKDGPYLHFRDEMTSNEMVAYFKGEHISHLKLINMANTSYHVVDDSLLAGNNEASGDTIRIDFHEGDIKRIQVQGGALGKFKPENNNTKIDTTVFYGGEYIDYHIDEQFTFLSQGAFMEYQDTRLSAGEILANWETNIMDAILENEEYPTVQTKGEAPMKGNSMVFDLVAKHGRIVKGRTSLNQGFYHGREVYRDDPNVFHVKSSKYTSCDLYNPHFYLGSRKMKMLPGDRVIAKPLWLHIYDMPIIGLPLAVFPNKGGKRHSGWIMPSFDSYKSIGTGFRNFGYYWAPNDYMDEKVLINFFDEQGVHVSSYFKYKKRNGLKRYNFQYNGNITGTVKRRIIDTDEIIDLADEKYVKEDQRLSWNHSQKFDPTQRLAIKYEYVSNKDAYQNDQEVNLQNRLKQNLSSSFNYSKNWKTSSASVGYNTFRDLSIENKTPESFSYLNEGRYKSYKYEDGPKFNFRTGSRKIFGMGDSWYNSLTSSYSMKTSTGRRDHWLIKQDDNSWLPGDTTKLKHGGMKHSANLSAPQTFFKWLTVNPKLSLKEDWIFNYKMKDEAGDEKEVEGFKRRLTGNSSLSAKTKIYGLFPITIGGLNAIRHVITPTISYQYQPDFSDPKWGGNLYFQDGDPNNDYFKGSYVGSTSKTEKKTYKLSLDNVFQAKTQGEKGEYNKSNFLNWNSSISYNALADSLKLSEMNSNVRVKSLSGAELFRLKMYHNFYKLGADGEHPVDEMVNIQGGELPRLTRMTISTDMKLKLFGTAVGDIEQTADSDSTGDIEDEFYFIEEKSKLKKSNNIWESKLQFKYSANWKYTDDEWDYRFSLTTVNSINLSKNWTLSYMADFNLKDREMTYHSFRVYRPLHCWEFSFNYWPRGGSAGFSLQINVKNPDLQDIKLTSKDGKRGFGGF